jgi:hypothetical protein
LLGRVASALFVTEKGMRLTDCGARYNFGHASQRIGLRADQQYCRHGQGPRIDQSIEAEHLGLSLKETPSSAPYRRSN